MFFRGAATKKAQNVAVGLQDPQYTPSVAGAANPRSQKVAKT